MSDFIVRLEKACVRLGGVRILRDLDWELRPGEHWAVVGDNGSGKSTLLRLVRGDIWPEQSGGRRLYIENGGASESPIGVRSRIATVSAELQDFYVQRDLKVKALEVVLTGGRDGQLLYSAPSEEELQAAREALKALNAEHLADRTFIRLSRGEARRVILARALASKPEMLLLDEYLDGLDRRSRSELANLLDRLAERGVRLVVCTHEPGALPDCVKQAIRVNGGLIADRGEVNEILGKPRPKESVKNTPAEPSVSPSKTMDGEVFRVERATVRREGRVVLQDVSWTARRGEHWALVGANGAGKSTLLGLLRGELHPLPGGRVIRFDNPEEPLEEVKTRMGWVSPALQASLEPSMTVNELVLGGFFASIGLHHQETNGEMERKARKRLAEAGLAGLWDRTVDGLSYGQLRRALLVRTLIQDPEVVLLDEPLAGLDIEARALFRRTIKQAMGRSAQVFWATHDPQELPGGRWRVLEVAGGHLIERQTKE
ncbi:MAG: ABC transporter ATP-binding protein [Desulfovibrionaceae bacterium]